MTTNLQIGLAYSIGKVENGNSGVIKLWEVLGDEYKGYKIIGLPHRDDEKPICLYVDKAPNFPRIITINLNSISLGQAIQLLNEAISCYRKNHK